MKYTAFYESVDKIGRDYNVSVEYSFDGFHFDTVAVCNSASDAVALIRNLRADFRTGLGEHRKNQVGDAVEVVAAHVGE